jgi:branched-chain amino acid transport system substrate-binding protein
MASSAELAFKEASDSGNLLGGEKIIPVRADSTCIDAAAATTAAERLVTAEKVAGIMGADCSGVTIAVANNVAVPNGIPMVSPSATSPALSTISDNGYFFRTAPSDARQGQLLAEITLSRGIKSVAVTYVNSDYGKGLADSFVNAFKKLGGEITVTIPTEGGKADYSAEVATLDSAGGEALAVFSYVDQGGPGIIQPAIDSGAFDRFILADGMFGDSLHTNVDGDLTGSFGTVPGSASNGAELFKKIASGAGINNNGPFIGESYDAAALLVLAMQRARSTNGESIADNLLAVANAPGTKILPGELSKGLSILNSGGPIDYVGATNVELNGVGETFGSYREFEIADKSFKTIRFH